MTDPQPDQTTEPAAAPSEPTEASPVPAPAPESAPTPGAESDLSAAAGGPAADPAPAMAAEPAPAAEHAPEPGALQPAPDAVPAESAAATTAESAPAAEHAPEPGALQPAPDAVEPAPDAVEPAPDAVPAESAAATTAESAPDAEHAPEPGVLQPAPDAVEPAPDAVPAEADAPDATPNAAAADEPALDATPDRSPTSPPVEPAPQAEPAAAPEPEPPVTVRRTVSQEVARQLHAAGARYCFTVPAEPILPLLDDLAEAGIRVVTARHEGSAAFMAEALAQSTGRPQIVAASRAVGAANAAVGIHTAMQDSAPLVALTGQVDRAVAGREAFQESDLVGGVGSLAMWASQIDRPSDTATVLGKAWRRLTTGRPGPVLLSVPVNVQTEEVELLDEPPPKAPGARGPAADRAAVSQAMKMLAASERGVIVAGAGVLRARATKRLVALSEALAVPVIAAWRRPDVFPNDHANYLGMAGSWAAPTVQQRLADADVILFVGTRLSEITTGGYAAPGPETRWVHVDVQPRVAHAGLQAPTLSIAADASRFLDSAWSDLRAAALDNEMRSRREARNAADREAYRQASDVTAGEWTGHGAHPGRVLAMLRAALPDNATITTDAGNLAGFVARGYRFRRAGTFLGATSGTMGFGLPAAVAASIMDPDRIAVALCGDGGFAMTMHELETAVREGAHPIAVVLDNQRYGTIAGQQLKEGRSTASTDLGAIDFAAIAEAHGALGFSVDDDASFEGALREAITARRTSVIHVKVDRAWLSVDETPVVAS